MQSWQKRGGCWQSSLAQSGPNFSTLIKWGANRSWKVVAAPIMLRVDWSREDVGSPFRCRVVWSGEDAVAPIMFRADWNMEDIIIILRVANGEIFTITGMKICHLFDEERPPPKPFLLTRCGLFSTLLVEDSDGVPWWCLYTLWLTDLTVCFYANFGLC